MLKTALSRSSNFLRSKQNLDLWIFLGLAMMALGMRLWDLGGRPYHYDESLHTHYSWRLFAGEGYRHEPWMHGPLQFFLNALVFAIFWDDDFTARLIYTFFGAGLVFLPYFLRNYTGRAAAIIASVMLAVSPMLLYFSRYSRNDIIMGFFAFALFILIWRYLHERKNRYLYMTAAVLALSLASKETAFIVIGIAVVLLLPLAMKDLMRLGLRRKRLKDMASPATMLLLIGTLTLPQWSALISLVPGWSGSEGMVLVYTADDGRNPVGLPLWGAPFLNPAVINLPALADAFILGGIAVLGLLGVFMAREKRESIRDSSGRVVGVVKAKSRRVVLVGGLMLIAMAAYAVLALADVEVSQSYLAAGGILIGTATAAAALGLMWNWRVWLISAGIFYFLWLAFYTSMFGALTRPYVECPDTLSGVVDVACTRLGGAFTGVWQSLGYWIAQHDVTRGNQPWFYYILTMSVYEFLPLVFGLIGVGYYFLKREFLGLALALWSLMTFALYSVAGEKMPWLTANLAVPFAMLAGKFAGDLFDGLLWRRLVANRGIILVVAAPALLVAAVYLLQRFLAADNFNDWRSWTALASTVVLVIVVGNLIWLARPRVGIALSLLSVGVLMLGFTAFSAGRAAYTRDDYPVELLVYAGASEDIRTLSEELRDQMADLPPEKKALVDYEIWYPFAWYVRSDKYIEFRCFKDPDEAGYVDWCNKISETSEAGALALLDSHGRRDAIHLTKYAQTGPHRDLLWFPEVYRRPDEDRKKESFREELPKDISFARDRVQDKESWRGGLDYFLYRKLSSEWWDTKFFTYLSVQQTSLSEDAAFDQNQTQDILK